MDEQTKLTLLELEEDRYGQYATLITSQFSTGKWYDLIANPTLADAMCDRLVHNSCQIQLKGESVQIKSKSNSG